MFGNRYQEMRLKKATTINSILVNVCKNLYYIYIFFLSFCLKMYFSFRGFCFLLFFLHYYFYFRLFLIFRFVVHWRIIYKYVNVPKVFPFILLLSTYWIIFFRRYIVVVVGIVSCSITVCEYVIFFILSICMYVYVLVSVSSILLCYTMW